MTRIWIPNWTKSVCKANSNNYGKHSFIYHNRLANHHHPIDNSCASFHDHRQITSHSHRQPSISVIGIVPSPPLDLTTLGRFIIGINLHLQLLYSVTICSPADLRLINSQIRAQRYVSKNGVNTCPPILEYKIINAPKFSSAMMSFRNYSLLTIINYQIQTTSAQFSNMLIEFLNFSNQNF